LLISKEYLIHTALTTRSSTDDTSKERKLDILLLLLLIIIIIIIIEILEAQVQILRTKYHATKTLQTQKTASAERVNSWVRNRPHYIISIPNIGKSAMSTQQRFNVRKKKTEGILDTEHQKNQGKKLVETSHEHKVTILLNKKCKPTEPSVTINQTL
jgi:hypothetical protein